MHRKQRKTVSHRKVQEQQPLWEEFEENLQDISGTILGIESLVWYLAISPLKERYSANTVEVFFRRLKDYLEQHATELVFLGGRILEGPKQNRKEKNA